MTTGVAAFTDTYLPTVNGVSYTIRAWRDHWHDRGGRMDVVFPRADSYDPDDGEHPVRSLPFPFYDGYRLGTPSVPNAVADVELVHAHTPFSIGVAGLRLARKRSVPFVASYHTPTSEYTEYLAPTAGIATGLERITRAWERWFLDRADAVVTPSAATKRHLREEVGVETPVHVIPNGVDTDFFRPVDTADFLRRHDIEPGRSLVGYTGRQGYEKRLSELIRAAEDVDATVLMGGDGPAREALERQAERSDADVRFLGFLEREDLPAFYAALDVFAFPSPVETQGLVALEAFACGTPVVGCNEGALANTIDDGETGYHYPSGDPAAFADAIDRALAEYDQLNEACLARRESESVDDAVEELSALYEELM
jgi:glycosyltransferase involved in cell wall biosynthesis